MAVVMVLVAYLGISIEGMQPGEDESRGGGKGASGGARVRTRSLEPQRLSFRPRGGCCRDPWQNTTTYANERLEAARCTLIIGHTCGPGYSKTLNSKKATCDFRIFLNIYILMGITRI